MAQTQINWWTEQIDKIKDRKQLSRLEEKHRSLFNTFSDADRSKIYLAIDEKKQSFKEIKK